MTFSPTFVIIVLQNEKREGKVMWNLEGMQVWGSYLDSVEVSGRVTLSRVAYGGSVQHHIKLDKGLSIAEGRVTRPAGDVIIIEHKHITRVKD